jgi:hypothetical protein
MINKSIFEDVLNSIDDFFAEAGWKFNRNFSKFQNKKSNTIRRDQQLKFPEIRLIIEDVPKAELQFENLFIGGDHLKIKLDKQRLDELINKLIKVQKLMENSDDSGNQTKTS